MALPNNVLEKNVLNIIMNVPSLIPTEPGNGREATATYRTASINMIVIALSPVKPKAKYTQ